MNKHVILVDDEPLARVNLRKVIEQYTDWKIVLELQSGEGIEDVVNELKPDIIFLDIRMPRRDGLATAQGLLQQSYTPLIVFVSAYSEHAVKAFDLYALDYLLKPFSDERFKQTVARLEGFSAASPAYHQLCQQQRESTNSSAYLNVLIVRSVSVIHIVDVKDVIWFSGSGNYVEVTQQDAKHLHRVSLNYLEENLDPHHFVRCHRSAIVRISSIKEIKTQDDGQMQLVLENGDMAKLSQSYRDRVMAAIECR